MLFGRVPYRTAFGLLLGASVLFRLAYAPWVPLTSDELMHWEWSRHLDLGYPEHPPLIAWLIALSTSVFGSVGLSVRLVPILAVSLLFAVGFRLSMELFDERAAFFGVVPLMLTPIFNVGGLLANTDGLLACCWMLSVYAVKRAVLDGKRAAWIAVGLFSGLTLLAKLPGIFLVLATVLFLAGSSVGRSWLRRWEPYAAWALALAVFSPVLVWNMRHGWPTIAMRVGHQSAGGFGVNYLAELIGAQMLIVTPFLFGWVVWGLYRSWKGRKDLRLWLVGCYMAVPFLFYMGYSLSARAGIHWPAIGYVTGFLGAGALTAASNRRPLAGRLLASASVPAVLLTGTIFFIPLFPEAVTMTWSYWVRPEKVSTSQLNNIFDWGELGEEIGKEYEQGSAGGFLLCRQGYGLAGLTSFYTPGQPAVFLWELQGRNGASFDMWKTQTDLTGRDAVIIDDELDGAWLDELNCCFESLSEPRRVEIRRGGRVIREFYLVRGKNFSGFPQHLLLP